MPVIWNERLGWLLILVGLSVAVGLDPWSLSQRDPDALPGSTRMTTRHAHAVVLAMGFLQLAVVRLLREGTLAESLRRLAGPLLAGGTLIYAAGYLGLIGWSWFAWWIPIGAGVNVVGFALLGWASCQPSVPAEVRVVLAIFLFGMGLDVGSGLYAIDADRFMPAYVGSDYEVRLRMLRLARVAATALSLLTLLFRDLRPAGTLGRWGRLGMMVGTLGMPTVLTAACFLWVDLKYLLPIPALAMTGGVLVGLVLARQSASPLEQCGWLLVVLSMNVGLLVGLYAFDGPMPTPAFVGSYNEFVRRLIRLGHAYAIVFGLLAVLLGRLGVRQLVSGMFLISTCVTMLAICTLAVTQTSSAILIPGPALTLVTLVVALCWDHLSLEKSRDYSDKMEPKQVEGTTLR